jgi:uncharacterized protein
MFTKHWFILPVLFLLLVSPVLAYTSPGSPIGFVSDFADILTPEQEANLNARLTTLANGEGSEMSVVTVPNLDGDTVENYAVSLFADWKIGKEGKDNGLLLLVAIEEREMRIEVGYGLERTITDAQAYWIINDVITPAFKNGDYYTGISGAVDKVTEAITGGVVLPSSQAAPDTTGEGTNITSIIAIVFIALAAFLGRTKSFWLGGVIGLIIGVIGGLLFGTWLSSLIGGGILCGIGLFFDYIVSRGGVGGTGMGGGMFRGGGGSSGGGFGGFGGGSSGGGGASGRW